MNAESIQTRVRKAFEKMNLYSSPQSLKDDDNLFNLGALDSLIMIQFVLGLEDEFGLRLNNQDISYENFQSFNAISNIIKKYNRHP